MTEKEIVNQNLDLLAEFMKCAFENADILDRILPNSELVILPENNPTLYEENIKIVKSHQRENTPVTLVKMKIPKPIIPQIEVMVA